jgi:hypothetical protein
MREQNPTCREFVANDTTIGGKKQQQFNKGCRTNGGTNGQPEEEAYGYETIPQYRLLPRDIGLGLFRWFADKTTEVVCPLGFEVVIRYKTIPKYQLMPGDENNKGGVSVRL